MNILMPLLVILIGWFAGILLNFLADLLPSSPRKWQINCHDCHKPRSFVDYVTMRSCRFCGQNRSFRAWIVQIAAVLGLVLLWFFPPDRFGFWVILPYMFYFALVAIIDIEHRLILHIVSLVGAILVLPIGLIWNGWRSMLIGGAAGAGIMVTLYLLGELFRRGVSKSRHEEVTEEALGFGDVTLSAVLGLMLGWPKIGFDIIFAIFLAGLVSAAYLLWMAVRRKYHPFTAIPYGPFLLVGAIILIYLA
ncbi:MAG TPA: A24 family peptidase [Longilinea sp.]|nr:A24 family peptidase [Longilinea sp.]